MNDQTNNLAKCVSIAVTKAIDDAPSWANTIVTRQILEIVEEFQEGIQLVGGDQELNLQTRVGRFGLLYKWMVEGRPFFERIFLNKRDGKPQDTTMLSYILWSRSPTARNLMLLASIIETQICTRGVPIDVLRDYSISFDQGSTVTFFGPGIPRAACAALANSPSKSGLFRIKLNEDSKIILNPNKLKSFQEYLELKESEQKQCFMFHTNKIFIVLENHADQKIVFLHMGDNAIFGICGSYTKIFFDNECPNETISINYALLPEKRSQLAGKSPESQKGLRKSALYSHPDAFMKRKFVNACYKDAYKDILEIEVHEEPEDQGQTISVVSDSVTENKAVTINRTPTQKLSLVKNNTPTKTESV